MELDKLALLIQQGAKRIDTDVYVGEQNTKSTVYEASAYKVGNIIRIDLKPKES